jgi:hypothetical protein
MSETPKADLSSIPNVRFAYRAPPPHSITSSARASSVGGTVEAERLGGLEVDHQLVLGRRLHRQVGRLLALEDAIDVAGRAASFDHLVGAGEQRRRHVEAERLGGLEVDHQSRTWSAPAPAGRPASRP